MPEPRPVAVYFPEPLVRARFLERPNRFLLHVQRPGVDGPDEVHLPDPGRLRELLVPGAEIWMRPASGPARRTRWSAVLTRTPDGSGWVSIDTSLPNRLIGTALQAGALEEFSGWSYERAEYRHGRSRFDFLLSRDGGARMALEVKSVTLVEDGVARFPDAVTARGARHVRELAELAGQDGWSAAVLFVLQRQDGTRIEAARAIDPDFADALEAAQAAGVAVFGRRCHVDPARVTLGDGVPVAPA